MKSFVNVLLDIRESPHILGRPTVRNLYMFLSGLAYGRKENGTGDYQVLADFGTFVHQHFEIYSTQSWAQIIEFFSVSETEEMKLFWELWDAFCGTVVKIKNKDITSPKSLPLRKKRRA